MDSKQPNFIMVEISLCSSWNTMMPEKKLSYFFLSNGDEETKWYGFTGFPNKFVERLKDQDIVDVLDEDDKEFADFLFNVKNENPRYPPFPITIDAIYSFKICIE